MIVVLPHWHKKKNEIKKETKLLLDKIVPPTLSKSKQQMYQFFIFFSFYLFIYLFFAPPSGRQTALPLVPGSCWKIMQIYSWH